jgi:hypothetical protein
MPFSTVSPSLAFRPTRGRATYLGIRSDRFTSTPAVPFAQIADVPTPPRERRESNLRDRFANSRRKLSFGSNIGYCSVCAVGQQYSRTFMTITIAWLRRRKQTTELVIASDSRLRSYGHMDQAQKLFILARGDCCLAFCGDAQVAYPLFIQVATALDNFGKTRTRASDTIDIRPNIRDILNNLIDSWDATLDEKRQQLADTKILFGGWSCRRLS